MRERETRTGKKASWTIGNTAVKVIQVRRSSRISCGPCQAKYSNTDGINSPITIKYEVATPKHLATIAKSMMICHTRQRDAQSQPIGDT